MLGQRLATFYVLVVLAGSAAAQESDLPLRTEFLMVLHADLVQPQQEIGETPVGDRRIFYVEGGSFSGPKLKGKVLPGGGDWVVIGRNRVAHLDVRITLRTDDGALIFVTYRGISDIPQKVRQRFSNGEDVPPSEYYFRTTPTFETAAPKYAWLNRLVAVGVGKRLAAGVTYNVYAIK